MFDMLRQISLMEGLICAQIKLTPARSLCNWKNNPIDVPLLAPRFTKRQLISSIGIMGSLKSFNSVAAASVQPPDDSAMSRFDNTLPSKGTSLAWPFVMFCSYASVSGPIVASEKFDLY